MPFNIDEAGEQVTLAQHVWIGSTESGLLSQAYDLGNNPRYGNTGFPRLRWVNDGIQDVSENDQCRMYVISGLLTVRRIRRQ